MKYLITFLFSISTFTAISRAEELRRIPLPELRERIRGAWAGKMIGVSYGFPTEFRFLGNIVPAEKLTWSPDMIAGALKQDDLYVQMTFARVLELKGLGATPADFAEGLKASRYPLWHANQSARRALRRGASPDETATPKYNAHGQDIGFQIHADFIGLSSPGMPKSACDLITRASHILVWGESVHAGAFVAGMYSVAFFESDPQTIIEAGLACVPGDSDYAAVIRDVIELHRAHPDDWQEAWKQLNAKWDKDDCCPYGALAPLNIDAKMNGGYAAIGLLYGEGDFAKTMEIAARCGQDSDCNPCTAAGIWGASHGYAAIPAQYTQGLPAIAGEKFTFTDYTFDTISESTMKRAIALAESNGGRVEGEALLITPQKPVPIVARQFNIGKPIERITCDDPRWGWKGQWKSFESKKNGPEKFATEKDAEATIQFTGTGAMIVGPLVGAGGTADVYLDGKLDRTIDVWPDENRREAMESIWHKFNLSDGEHTIRLVVRGERFRESLGSEIRIHSLVVFR